MSSVPRAERFAWLATSRAVRFVAAAVLLAIVLTIVDARAVWSRLSTFDPAIAVLMLAVNALAFSLFAARWRGIARALGIDAPYHQFLKGTWLAALAAQLGPALILNEITRFHALRSHASPWPLAASQFLDRLSGQVVLLVLIGLLVPYYSFLFAGDTGRRIALAACGAGMLGALLLVLARRLRRFIRVKPGAFRAVLDPIASPHHYGCSLAIQLLFMANLWLAVAGISHGTPGVALYLAAPLVLGSLVLLPVSAGDWGSREAAALVFLPAAGLTTDVVVAASVAYGAINLVSALPAAFWVLRARGAPGRSA